MTKHPPPSRLLRLCALGAAALLDPDLASALPPVATSGYLEYLGRYENSESGADSFQNFMTLRVDAASFLWQPWIAQVYGGLGLTFEASEIDGEDRTGQIVTGLGRIRILPRSQFPFEAFLERTDTRFQGDLPNPEFQLTSYGFTQSYLPPAGGSYILGYRHTDRKDKGEDDRGGRGSNDSTGDEVSLALSRAFGRHSVMWNSNFDRVRRDDPDETTTNQLHLLRHRFATGPSLSFNNLASYNRIEYDREVVDTTTSFAQYSSTAFWRPRTRKPTSVTATALFTDNSTESGGADSDSQSLVFNAGATRQQTAAWALRALGSGAFIRGEDDDRHSAIARLGTTYAPAPFPLGRFSYSWSVGGDAGVRNDSEEGTSLQTAADFNHALYRSFPLYGGALGVNLNQGVSGANDSSEGSRGILTHSAGLGWDRRSGRAATALRFTGSDSRRYGDEGSSFQLLNLQANRSRQFTRLSGWNGGVTVQASRFNPDDSESEVDNGWVYSSSVDAVYQHRRAFGVPRLLFSSELRLFSDNLVPLMDSDEDDPDSINEKLWRNRLDYSIGRLELSFRVDLNESNDETDVIVYFQARRYFGGFQ